ncbi:DUF1697 domain-containing protein [Henriciella aquimarina]|uniref:DUF1697 domain-containing protein n=1 Tax=Henriciella aquimarina TaxID=545261 RepID=UPI000A04C2FA|nr:DUF1697 domain-containing protein [Henriciella aquimarina]
MKRWIVFLRGVNVSGSNRLPMKELRAVLEEEGYEKVETYIQSGNIVFDSGHENYADVSHDLTDLLREHFGITPRSHVYSPQDISRIIQLNPYKEEGLEAPKSVHFFLLAEPAGEANLERLSELKAYNEAFELTDDALYLHAPDGIGRSDLVKELDRALGVAMTGRNMRTLYKVAALAGLDVEDL